MAAKWRSGAGKVSFCASSMDPGSENCTSKLFLIQPELRAPPPCYRLIYDHVARNLHPGAVLPDEVHLLQLPHGSGLQRSIRTICEGGLPGDCDTSRTVLGGRSLLVAISFERESRYFIHRRRHTKPAGAHSLVGPGSNHP